MASMTRTSKDQVMAEDLSAPPEEGHDVIDAHVVILNNYLRIHHVVSYQELAKRVRKLTILLSVPMEPDRQWGAEWSDLDVQVQKNWMFTKMWKHSTGFQEANFIHVPVDTVSRLKQLKPDVVFSYEMGIRTLLAGWFRIFNRKVPLVMVGNMSEFIERERGIVRRTLRGLIRRTVDFCTYNGPSCKRYLQGLGVASDRLFHVPYCIDDQVAYLGERSLIPADKPRTLLYCGSISPRKGVVEFTSSLNKWCVANPQRKVVLNLAGSGDTVGSILELATDNLEIVHLGSLDAAGLKAANRDADICLNPSLADEWGLVPIEALASGVPVLGCEYAQSVETVIEEGVNGWKFRTDDQSSMDGAIQRAMACSNAELDSMVGVCRQSVAHISPAATASRFVDVVRHALPNAATITR
jgi:glycosyltransferase involved in cell wall biosynthesis